MFHLFYSIEPRFCLQFTNKAQRKSKAQTTQMDMIHLYNSKLFLGSMVAKQTNIQIESCDAGANMLYKRERIEWVFLWKKKTHIHKVRRDVMTTRLNQILLHINETLECFSHIWKLDTVSLIKIDVQKQQQHQQQHQQHWHPVPITLFRQCDGLLFVTWA